MAYAVDAFSSQIEHIYSKSARCKPTGNPLLKLGFIALSLALSFGLSNVAPPPPAKICGTLRGPPVTTSRLRFPDGRPVAYAERGVPKRDARHKIVLVHDYGRSRLDQFPCAEETLEKHGVYMVSFDRAGYGESHPFPHRSVASEARDIDSLADALELGPKFYVVAVGLGAYAGWGCIRHIPHRLAGVAMISPVANFWWPSSGSGSAASEALERLGPAERYTLRVAHYAPRLLYHYTKTSWLPASNMETISQASELATQQGIHESLHRDLMIQFGSWDFSPAELKNPFSAAGSGGGAVHVWQSSHDLFFPSSLQEWLRNSLPWLQLHAIPGETRHSWIDAAGLPDDILVRMLFRNQTHA